MMASVMPTPVSHSAPYFHKQGFCNQVTTSGVDEISASSSRTLTLNDITITHGMQKVLP